jgi:hypothetical protein
LRIDRGGGGQIRRRGSDLRQVGWRRVSRLARDRFHPAAQREQHVPHVAHALSGCHRPGNELRERLEHDAHQCGIAFLEWRVEEGTRLRAELGERLAGEFEIGKFAGWLRDGCQRAAAEQPYQPAFADPAWLARRAGLSGSERTVGSRGGAAVRAGLRPARAAGNHTAQRRAKPAEAPGDARPNPLTGSGS